MKATSSNGVVHRGAGDCEEERQVAGQAAEVVGTAAATCAADVCLGRIHAGGYCSANECLRLDGATYPESIASLAPVQGFIYLVMRSRHASKAFVYVVAPVCVASNLLQSSILGLGHVYRHWGSTRVAGILMILRVANLRR